MCDQIFLSTLSLRRATDTGGNDNGNAKISIHALLAESDYLTNYHFSGVTEISIHALLAESDFRKSCEGISYFQFLSTLSLRRATTIYARIAYTVPHFYPRSPCGERPKMIVSQVRGRAISIHALLAESDDVSLIYTNRRQDFYPRSPCGERRRGGDSCYLDNIISIHALLAESDHGLYSLVATTPSFLSTLSLRRATHGFLYGLPKEHLFLSTLSLRRATLGLPASQPSTPDFYPRSPCGERPFIHCNCNFTQKFLSTLSLRRATLSISKTVRRIWHFYPRSPCGERRLTIMLYDASVLIFLSTLSLRRATVTVLGIQHRCGISIHALLAESDLCRAIGFSA